MSPRWRQKKRCLPGAAAAARALCLAGVRSEQWLLRPLALSWPERSVVFLKSNSDQVFSLQPVPTIFGGNQFHMSSMVCWWCYISFLMHTSIWREQCLFTASVQLLVFKLWSCHALAVISQREGHWLGASVSLWQPCTSIPPTIFLFFLLDKWWAELHRAFQQPTDNSHKKKGGGCFPCFPGSHPLPYWGAKEMPKKHLAS